jgi:hypothetical protein
MRVDGRSGSPIGLEASETKPSFHIHASAALEVQKQALRADHICAQVTALPEQLRAPLGHGEHCSFGSGGTRRPSGDSPT